MRILSGGYNTEVGRQRCEGCGGCQDGGWRRKMGERNSGIASVSRFDFRVSPVQVEAPGPDGQLLTAVF